MGSGGLEGVPREVIQWLHDRGVQLGGRSIKRQMANGLLAAQILETTFPHEVQALMFDRGLSLQVRRHNWNHLLQLCRKLHIELSPSKVEQCAYESHEACVGVLSDLYAALTARSPESLKVPSTRPSPPAYTAPTAAQLLKNGLLYMNPDEMETISKTQAVIQKCLQKRSVSHKERLLRVYEQWLPEGATESLFLPTRRRASPPPPPHAAPPSMPFAAAFSGTAKAGPRPQTQQQATLLPGNAEATLNKGGGFGSGSPPAGAVPKAASAFSEDSD